MAGQRGKSNTIWIVLAVVVGFGVLICGGGALWAFLGVKRIAEDPQGFQSGLVTQMAGDSHLEATEYCLMLLSRHATDEAWGGTSEGFKGETDREGFQALHDSIGDVMGDLVSLKPQNYNVNHRVGTGAGTFHALVYQGTFTNGEGTVEITLQETEDGFYLHRLFVRSPLFETQAETPPEQEPAEETPELDEETPATPGPSDER